MISFALILLVGTIEKDKTLLKAVLLILITAASMFSFARITRFVAAKEELDDERKKSE